MSGKKPGVPWTSQSAPRKGGKLGRKAKLSAAAMEILNKLLLDWQRHGTKTLRILRLENPQAYARLVLEASAKLALNDAGADAGPMLITVRWGDPRHPSPRPPEISEPPPHTPPPAGPAKAAPRLLTLLPNIPA